jgi:hypothetical protein
MEAASKSRGLRLLLAVSNTSYQLFSYWKPTGGLHSPNGMTRSLRSLTANQLRANVANS